MKKLRQPKALHSQKRRFDFRKLRRWAEDLANYCDQPKELLRRFYARNPNFSEHTRPELEKNLQLVATAMMVAFEMLEPSSRHYCLSVARYRNAEYRPDPSSQLPFFSTAFPEEAARIFKKLPLEDQARLFPRPRPDDETDRALWIVQTQLADKMTKCIREGCAEPYFFRKRPRQKYCTDDCFQIVNRANKNRWEKNKRGKATA